LKNVQLWNIRLLRLLLSSLFTILPVFVRLLDALVICRISLAEFLDNQEFLEFFNGCSSTMERVICKVQETLVIILGT